MGTAYSYLYQTEDNYEYTLFEEAKEREAIEMYENKNIYFYCKNYIDIEYNDSNSRRTTLQEEE